MADMPDIAVARVDLLLRLLDGNFMLFGVVHRRLARGEGEVRIFPGSDNPQRRIERHIGQFEPDLIVALARGAVRDGGRAFGMGDIDLMFRDQRAGDTRAQQIFVFVDRSGLQHRPEIILDKFLPQIFDDTLDGAAGQRFSLYPC